MADTNPDAVKQESRREIAARIVRNANVDIGLRDRRRLADAIEVALKDRDERAAKIAETDDSVFVDELEWALRREIAVSIRNQEGPKK